MRIVGNTKRIVIVGGGFAGLTCARELASHDECQITLLDKNNYQQFQPLLYQVATGTLSADNAAFNLRSVLSHRNNIDIQMAEVASVDLATRTAFTADGDSYQGDVVVLAAGAQANFFGVPGVREHAMPLYSLLDAQHLRSRMIEVLERADRGARSTQNLPHFVVIGGGPTGVEIAGAIGDVLKRTPTTLFKHLDLRGATVTLVDHAQTVLSPFGSGSQNYATKMLRECGVELELGASVTEVTASCVVLSDGRKLPAQLVIWGGGLKASALSAAIGIQTGRGGRVDVEPDLTVTGFPGVYALGDFANCKSTDGEVLPQLASVAQQAGKHCARNIIAFTSGRSGEPFRYVDKGIMAMIGRDAAVAEVGSSRRTIVGLPAFVAWLGVHALLLTTLRAKFAAVLEWGWQYFGHVRVDAILDRPSQVRPEGSRSP